MAVIYLSDEKKERPPQIFIPTSAEINLIYFLNLLPAHGYSYIPDDNKLVLDFELCAGQNGEERVGLEKEIRILYQEKEYTGQQFLESFTGEKEFYVG